MRASLIVLALLMLSASPAHGQVNADSLWSVWADESRPAQDRANAIEAFAIARYQGTNPDSLIICGQLMQRLARTAGLDLYVGRALMLKSKGLMSKGEVDAPMLLLDSAIAIFEAIGEEALLVRALNTIASAHAGKGDYARGIAKLTRALRMAEARGDSSMTARILGNIGALYHMQDDLDNALEYYQRRLVIAEAIGQKDILGEVIGNIGVLYNDKGDFGKALEHHKRAQALAREIGYAGMESNATHNIGSVYIKLGRYEEAIEQFKMELAMTERAGEMIGVSSAMAGLAEACNAMGQHAQALVHGRRSLELATASGDMTARRNSAEVLYVAYKALGQDDAALRMHETFIALRDSIRREENQAAMMTQKFQYEFDKKESLLIAEQEKKDALAAEELRRRNVQRNAFIGGFALMLLLAGTFLFQRNRINKEKQRSEDLLLNILPEEVAEELKLKGEAEAVHLDQVTVLFTDFNGFTAMSEVVTPKQLVRDLHECFSAFDHICEKHGLEKIKTIGDAYMAAGGLPTPNTTHATDVIKAAMEMRDFIADGKARKIAAGLPYFEIRIGIHTGPVVAGIVGVKKFQYDIWGDTVNTASRMESSSEVGQVNISEATYALVKDEPTLTFTSRGKVQAKGKGELEMYFVQRPSNSA